MSQLGKLLTTFAIAIAAASTSGCALFGGGGDQLPRPQWANDQSTGKFDTGRYLVGKGIAPMSGDPVADSRAVRDSAKADMLGQLITEVVGEFRQQVGEYKLGDKWSSTNESMSSVRTTVQGVLDVTFEEEFYRDTDSRTIYVLLAVERSKYGASLRHRLQTIADDQRVKLQAIESRLNEKAPLHALRGIAALQATVPGWIATGASLAAVAGQGARPATTVTPELLASLNDRARAGLVIHIDVKASAPPLGLTLDTAAIRSDVAAALQALRITTGEASKATHKLTVTITPHASQVSMDEAGVRFAVASIGWHLSMAVIDGSDYGFTASNKADSNRVSKAGTGLAQALAESLSKAGAEMRDAIVKELLPS